MAVLEAGQPTPFGLELELAVAGLSVTLFSSSKNMNLISLISLWIDVMKPSNWNTHDLDVDMEVEFDAWVLPVKILRPLYSVALQILYPQVPLELLKSIRCW